MRITVFTSNQPRHHSLISRLAEAFEFVYAIQECNTIFPGRVQDFFRSSPVMQDYFSNVVAAERKVFGRVSFLPKNVASLALKSGDLALVEREILEPALSADAFLVFGASYIKGWLIDELVCRRAINIHMGLSPYYRGSSCNFWALYDDRAEFVGATIHLLSRGLDSGDMLYHCVPQPLPNDSSFDFSMRAVELAHRSVVERIASGEILSMPVVPQDKSLEIRYTRSSDFTDQVAAEFLARKTSLEITSRQGPNLLNPFIG